MMLQQLINILYRYPKSRLKTYKRFGGYINYKRMLQARNQMKLVAAKLPPSKSYPDGLPIYFLTGREYLYQTLFCISSLIKASSAKFHFTLIDDGTLNENLVKRINAQLPGAEIITAATIEENLEIVLPASRYPTLRAKRKVYPHLRKLTDIHIHQTNPWKLVLDSDMLFWNDPVELISWLKHPDKPLHLIDCINSYGYSNQLMERLCQTKIKPMINVGAIGFNSNSINWDDLESWIKTLEATEGTSYYLEQALTAMLLGNQDSVTLAASDYIVNPDSTQVHQKTGILHHYVDTSKESYFKIAWQLINKSNVR